MFWFLIWLIISVSLTDGQLQQDDNESSTTFNEIGHSNTIPNDSSTALPKTSSKILEFLEQTVTKHNRDERENDSKIENISESSSSTSVENPSTPQKDNNVDGSIEKSSSIPKTEEKKSAFDFSTFMKNMPKMDFDFGGMKMEFGPGFDFSALEGMKGFGVDHNEEVEEITTTPKVETTGNNLLVEKRIEEIEAELFAVFKEEIPKSQKKNKNQSLDNTEIFRGRNESGKAEEEHTESTPIPQYDFGTDAVFQEFDGTNEKEEKAKRERNMQRFSLGDLCTLATSHLCENFPRITCQRKESTGGIQNYYCSCSHLHTQHTSPERGQYCVSNVFTPCSDLTGDTFPCGENMSCQNDSLGIDGFKYCRCLPGFIPKENEDYLPAECIPHNGTRILDVAENYQSASFSLSPLTFLLISTLVFFSFSSLT